MLENRKTYIVALGIIVAALVQFTTADATLGQTVAMVLGGTGMATLRAGMNPDSKFGAFVGGYKTHIVAFGVVVSAVVSYLTGEMSMADAVNTALVGTGLSGLRIGVSKATGEGK